MRRLSGVAGGLVWIALVGCRDGSPEASTATAPQPRPLAPELRPAATALEQRRNVEARELARAFLATHPGDGQALFLVGMSYHGSGNYGAARPWLEQALEVDPGFWFAHAFLGEGLFLVGELEPARREYEAYLAAVPEDPKGHYAIGLIEFEETRLDAAAERFERAIDLFAALERRDPREAAARRPERAECHARLGEVHFARGEYEAARAELLRATEIAPENISAFYTLSLVHRRLGEEDLADRAAARYESARRALIEGQKAPGR